MRGYSLSRVLLGIYRWCVGDVQVVQTDTTGTLERTIYLGYMDSKYNETRVFYHVRQVRYLKIYSRWWLWTRPKYVYNLDWVKFVGVDVMDKGHICYPELCAPWFRWSKRPYLLATDCHIRQFIADYKPDPDKL